MTVLEALHILKRVLNQTLIDRVFQALGDPTRRRIVDQLSRGPLSISDLAKPLDITLAAVVQHVQVLEESGIVRTEKVGRVRSCRIDGGGLRLAEQWLSQRRATWQERFDRLGDLLDAEEAKPARASKKRSKR